MKIFNVSYEFNEHHQGLHVVHPGKETGESIFFGGEVEYVPDQNKFYLFWGLAALCFLIVILGNHFFSSSSKRAVSDENNNAPFQDQITVYKDRILLSGVLETEEANLSLIACHNGKGYDVYGVSLDGSNFADLITRPLTKEDPAYAYTIRTLLRRGWRLHVIERPDGTCSSFAAGCVNWSTSFGVAMDTMLGWVCRWVLSFCTRRYPVLAWAPATWRTCLYADADLSTSVKNFGNATFRIANNVVLAEFETLSDANHIVGRKDDETVIRWENTETELTVFRQACIDKDQSLLSVLNYHDSCKERKFRTLGLKLFISFVLSFLVAVCAYFAVPCSALPTLCGYPQVWSPQLDDWYQCRHWHCDDYSTKYPFYICEDLEECEEIFLRSPYFKDEESPYFNSSFLDVRAFWYESYTLSYSNLTFGLDSNDLAFWRRCGDNCSKYFELYCNRRPIDYREYGYRGCTWRYMSALSDASGDFTDPTSEFYQVPFSCLIPNDCMVPYFWRRSCYDFDKLCCNPRACWVEYYETDYKDPSSPFYKVDFDDAITNAVNCEHADSPSALISGPTACPNPDAPSDSPSLAPSSAPTSSSKPSLQP